MQSNASSKVLLSGQLTGTYRCLLFGLVLAAVATAYSNHFHNSFHFDDTHAVVENPNIRSLRNLPHFFTDATTFSVLPPNRSWRPLVTASLAIDYWLGKGLSPFWFHLSTFLWFLIQIGLTFLLFERLFDAASPHLSNPYLALFGAALYGLHPACAETVNYVIQRGDLYSTLGVVAGLYLYVMRPTWRKYGLYLAPVAAGLLSKPPAVVFPGLVFLYAFLLEERSVMRSAIAALPSLALSMVFVAVNSAMTPSTFVSGAFSPTAYRITQPYVALRYFISFFLPVRLSADTDLRPLSSAADPAALAGLAFLAVLLGAIWLLSRRPESKPAAFGLAWFLIALVPAALVPLAEVENDHRMFFPFVGMSLSVACLLGVLWRHLRTGVPRAIAAACALAVLAGCGYGVHVRNQVWRDDLSLWRDVTIKSPANGRGHMNYGLALMSRGDLDGALAAFTRALAYTPSYSLLEINLGIVNGALHRDAEAERHFQRALTLAPSDSTPRFYYARWLEEKGRGADALAQASAALALNAAQPGAQEMVRRLQATAPAAPAPQVLQPRTPEQWLELSLTYYQQGRFMESVAAAQTAVYLRPGYAEAYNNVGAAYAALHLWDAAIRADSEALRLKPDFPLARNNLAWAMEQKRRGAR